MNGCLEYCSDLAAEAGGELDAPRGDRLRAHLASCSSCRRELAECEQVIQLARVTFSGEFELPGHVRARIAATARESVLERPFWWGWLASPLRPALAGLTAAAALLLVGVFVGRPGESPGAFPTREPVRLEMRVEEGGKVRLAWQDGRRAVYRVRKSADPKGLTNAETHIVRGNTWVDDAPSSSSVVFYQVD